MPPHTSSSGINALGDPGFDLAAQLGELQAQINDLNIKRKSSIHKTRSSETKKSKTRSGNGRNDVALQWAMLPRQQSNNNVRARAKGNRKKGGWKDEDKEDKEEDGAKVPASSVDPTLLDLLHNAVRSFSVPEWGMNHREGGVQGPITAPKEALVPAHAQARVRAHSPPQSNRRVLCQYMALSIKANLVSSSSSFLVHGNRQEQGRGPGKGQESESALPVCSPFQATFSLSSSAVFVASLRRIWVLRLNGTVLVFPFPPNSSFSSCSASLSPFLLSNSTKPDDASLQRLLGRINILTRHIRELSAFIGTHAA